MTRKTSPKEKSISITTKPKKKTRSKNRSSSPQSRSHSTSPKKLPSTKSQSPEKQPLSEQIKSILQTPGRESDYKEPNTPLLINRSTQTVARPTSPVRESSNNFDQVSQTAKLQTQTMNVSPKEVYSSLIENPETNPMNPVEDQPRT